MTFYVANTTVTSASSLYNLASNDTLLVGRDGLLANTGGGSVVNTQQGTTITVAGSLWGTSAGIAINGTNFGSSINIQSTGKIEGSSAVTSLTGANNIQNAGELTSASHTISFVSGGNYVNNSGTITARNSSSSGIYISAQSAGSGNDSIANSGIITSTSHYGLYSAAPGGTTLFNTGTVQTITGTYAVYTKNELILQNSGVVQGYVRGGSYSEIENGPSGQIFGYVTTGSGKIHNAGFISKGVGGEATDFLNTGTIGGYVSLGDGVKFLNSGQIAGFVAANSGDFLNTGEIDGYFVASGSVGSKLVNQGVLGSDIYAGSGADTYVNTGLIKGAVQMSYGADTLDNRGGVILGSVWMGTGDDVYYGGSARDVVFGEENWGDQSYSVSNDLLYGGGGDDQLNGGNGDDVLWGETGADVLNGGYGKDVLYGNQDDDILYGNQDDDWMHGGQGDDLLFGGQGADTLNGGVGDDVLVGGLGDDLFVFAPGFGHDVVTDFRSAGANDRIQFTAGVFTSFADLQAHMTQTAQGVLIADGVGDTVMLTGVAAANLAAEMFVFG